MKLEQESLTKYLNNIFSSTRHLYLNVNSFNDFEFDFMAKYRSTTIINQYNFHEQTSKAFSGQESVRTFSFHFEIVREESICILIR